jgi:hypothetical protein
MTQPLLLIGATSNMVKSKRYLTDITQITSEITMGNEEQFQCTEKGIYRGYFNHKHGQDVPIILTYTLVLLSNTKCITKHGVQFTANNRNSVLSIFGTQTMFDKKYDMVLGNYLN